MRAYAAQDTTDHEVTVVVPTILSISADVSNFTLTFSDFAQGSETNVQDIVYTVKSNNLTRNTGVIQGSIDSLFSEVELLADVGTYTKNFGNARLVESPPSGFKVIGTSSVNLCDRQVISGNGKVLSGSIPISYKAKATQALTSGSQVRQLTITITDT